MAQLIFRQRSYYGWEPADYATDEIFTAINVGVGDIVAGGFMRITEAFDGGSADATLELGDGGSTARYLATTDITVGTTGLYGGANLATALGHLYTAADTVDINCITDTNNDGTTGICDAWIYVAQAYPH
jgi:hypothetical protein